MSKNFGKIVLISSLLAGAAVGSYAYLKKEGIIDGESSVARDLASKVKSDADELLAKERNYVELNPEADATENDDTTENSDADSVEEFEPGIEAEEIEAADNNIIGSKTTEEFFNDEDEESEEES